MGCFITIWVWWRRTAWCKAVHVGIFQWQRLGFMQGEQEKHKFRVILLHACLIHSHSESQTSVFLEIRGRWDFGGYEFAGTRNLCQAGVLAWKSKTFFNRQSWQTMRKQWFYIDRIWTKENPADSTKALSKERREFLMNALDFRAALLKFQTACQFLDSSHCSLGGFGHAGSRARIECCMS